MTQILKEASDFFELNKNKIKSLIPIVKEHIIDDDDEDTEDDILFEWSFTIAEKIIPDEFWAESNSKFIEDVVNLISVFLTCESLVERGLITKLPNGDYVKND